MTPLAQARASGALQNLLRSAASAVECVELACDQIRSSERLAAVLRAVLATGNTLNCGTHRGNATAIKLESIGKMADVKVRNAEVFILTMDDCQRDSVCVHHASEPHLLSRCRNCWIAHHCLLLRQISAPLKGGEADGVQAARAAADANGNDAPDANGSVCSKGSVSHPAAAAVATLLEFVAWVVFTELPATARSASWFKGRGGYLADELHAVREASVRVQVRRCGTAWCTEHGIVPATISHTSCGAPMKQAAVHFHHTSSGL